MTDKRSSTGMTALAALSEDAELQRLIRGLERRFPGEGQSRAYDLIMNNLSTSTLTSNYGDDRPSGLELFRSELRLLAANDGN